MKFIFIVGITVGLSSDPQHYIGTANVFETSEQKRYQLQTVCG